MSIKLIIFDVDGTLTDGSYFIDEKGNVTKKFFCRDWDALENLKRNYDILLLTGSNKVNEWFAINIGLDIQVVKGETKDELLPSILTEYKVKKDEILFVGDSINDLELMKKIGYAMCPFNSNFLIKEYCEKKGTVIYRKSGEGIAEEIWYLLERGIQ